MPVILGAWTAMGHTSQNEDQTLLQCGLRNLGQVRATKCPYLAIVVRAGLIVHGLIRIDVRNDSD